MKGDSDFNVLYALGEGIGKITDERAAHAETIQRLECELAQSRSEVKRLTEWRTDAQGSMEMLRVDIRAMNTRLANTEPSLSKLGQMTDDLETMVAHLQGLMRTRAKGTAARREMLKPVVLQLRDILDFEPKARGGYAVEEEI